MYQYEKFKQKWLKLHPQINSGHLDVRGIAFLMKPVNRDTADIFARAVLADIHPRDSWRAAKAFREHIAVEMARRALIKSIELGGGVLDE